MREEILEMYFEKQMRPVDISKVLNLPQYKITRILQKDPRYEKKKRVRIENNRKKHKEDTKKIVKRKRTKEQFEYANDTLVLKVMQSQAARELSKHNKLSNLAYRNWNISAYEYDSNKKRFAFREELGRSADVPKYIKVEV